MVPSAEYQLNAGPCLHRGISREAAAAAEEAAAAGAAAASLRLSCAEEAAALEAELQARRGLPLTRRRIRIRILILF